MIELPDLTVVAVAYTSDAGGQQRGAPGLVMLTYENQRDFISVETVLYHLKEMVADNSGDAIEDWTSCTVAVLGEQYPGQDQAILREIEACW